MTWALRRELGLHRLLDPERELRNHDLDLLALERQARRNALITKDFLGPTIRRNATPIQILQQLLEQIGLRLMCARREGARGEQGRVYRLDLEQWKICPICLAVPPLKARTSPSAVHSATRSARSHWGDLDSTFNKQAAVTTTAIEGMMTPEDLAETLKILVQGATLQEQNLAQAVWSIVRPKQRLQLL